MPPKSIAAKSKAPGKGETASKDSPKKPRGRPPKKVKKESDDEEEPDQPELDTFAADFKNYVTPAGLEDVEFAEIANLHRRAPS